MINVIDQSKCTGCGTCFKSCSLDVFRINTNQPEQPPCMAACPAGTDIRGYNALLQQGKFEEAALKLQEANPFPAITGRVCFHPCEKECSRNSVDAPVNINALEQFLGDSRLADLLPQPAVRHTAKVAIIGSGPAGLSCAWYLAALGYGVTVFEALPRPGGMLRYGIPAYRLPDAIIEAQVARLEASGVAFRCNTRIGKKGDITLADLRKRGFSAFLLAPGASLSRKMDVGASLPGMHHGVEFLRAVRSGMAPALGKNVLVIGGGDVAVDAAISARRLGAEHVSMVSLEAEDQLPAYPHNQADAKAEGIAFECGWGPVKVEGTHAVTGMVLRRCLSVFNESGAFAPAFDNARTRTLAANSIIFAIGQTSDLAPFSDDVAISPRNTIITAEITQASSTADVFAAGDAATGPASAIKAIAGGREAAISIDRFLRGAHLASHREIQRPLVENLPGEGVPLLARNERSLSPEHGQDFAEMRCGFGTETALAEGMRCMTCGAKARIAYNDDCMTCFTCEMRCPAGAINVHPFKEILPRTLEIRCEDIVL